MKCLRVGLLSLVATGLVSLSSTMAEDRITVQPTVLTRNFGAADAPQVQFADLNAQNQATIDPVFHGHRGYYGGGYGYGYRPYGYGAYYHPYGYGAYYRPYVNYYTTPYYAYRPYLGYGYSAYYGGYGGCYHW